MSLLKTKAIFIAARNLSTSASRAAAWNKDWMPGPYPKTEKERSAAAKKYGLLPEEYKPIEDDGLGAGDYPHLEPLSNEARDPFYPWDFPEYRRNFGEPFHQHAVMYSEDRVNVNQRFRYSPLIQASCFFGALFISWVLMKLGEDACFFPAAKRHIPEPGKKHYSYD